MLRDAASSLLALLWAASAPLALALPSTAVQSGMRSYNGPFYITIRSANINSPHFIYDYIYISPAEISPGVYSGGALHGDASTFHLHEGVLSSEVTWTNASSGQPQTSVWKNMPLKNHNYAVWEPVQQMTSPETKGHINIQVGTNAFVEPGKGQQWEFCNDAEGNQLGLSVGGAHTKGVECQPVYAFLSTNPPASKASQ